MIVHDNLRLRQTKAELAAALEELEREKENDKV